jgi:hypothetical protein
VFDTSGSYAVVFMILTAFCVFGLLMSIMLRPMGMAPAMPAPETGR